MEEVFILYEDDRVKIERIYSNGWCQNEKESFISDMDEYVTLESGEAELEILSELGGKTEVFLSAGDGYFINRRTRHRVSRTTTETIWLTVYLKN